MNLNLTLRLRDLLVICYNYILEAKWEADPLSAGPLTKLSERLSTRPPGTRAIVLSATGFNSNALE
ncbi:hypothetical protein HXS80_11875 [Streptomyces sp. CB04723]|uniref:hypothetical protein n=1 Tax=Streptomyces TaxID=1883 RepID=UPI0015C4421A|nr:hypothetical protein [Streptomyces sp. CB04723]QLG32320.1 hypothetical protein HXS80_11875 [Streptomyces sp. CB04723]